MTSKSSDGAGISTGSIDTFVCCERNNSVPTITVEFINRRHIPMSDNKRQSLPDYGWAPKLVLK